MKYILLVIISFWFAILCAEENTYTISIMGHEVGESTELWEKIETGNRCIMRLTSTTSLKIARGQNVMNIKTKSISDALCDTFFPLSFYSESNEAGVSTIIKAVPKNNNKLLVLIERGGTKEERETELPKDTVFFGMIFKKYTEADFLKKKNAKVLSEESLLVRNLDWTAQKEGAELKINMNFQGLPIFSISENNIITYTSVQNGVMTSALKGKKISKENLQSKDILFQTSIQNKGKEIANPRNQREVTYNISGNIGAIPESCRQKVVKNNTSAVISILNSKSCSEQIIESKYTAGNVYENKDAPEIKKISEKWAAIERKKAVKNAVSFVFSYIKDKNYKYGNLSATEVLKNQSGDCTEHATLLSALLKSINIPTRMVYGLILSEDGRFYFHNWNEVYWDGGWHQVDSSFNQIEADSSRITLNYAENNGADSENISIAIIKLIQNIKISVK